jgi:acylphosphatase
LNADDALRNVQGGGNIKAMKRVTVHYAGRVHGVGFRATVAGLARGYDVTGTVGNLADGRVELVAEGEEVELRAFLVGIDESQLAGFIREKNPVWSDATGAFRGFKIVT